MIKDKLRNAGIVAGILLSLYGGINLVSDVYHRFKPKAEASKSETYDLFVHYCNPEREMCKASVVPSSVYIRRSSDGLLLWNSDIAPYPKTNRPSVERTWQDDRLSDILNGELRLSFSGEPEEN